MGENKRIYLGCLFKHRQPDDRLYNLISSLVIITRRAIAVIAPARENYSQLSLLLVPRSRGWGQHSKVEKRNQKVGTEHLTYGQFEGSTHIHLCKYQLNDKYGKNGNLKARKGEKNITSQYQGLVFEQLGQFDSIFR